VNRRTHAEDADQQDRIDTFAAACERRTTRSEDHRARRAPNWWIWTPTTIPSVAANAPVSRQQLIAPLTGTQIAYYQEMAVISSAQALAVQANYGITFHGDLAAHLMSRHHLHVGAIPRNWR
jgi:hypothetical protein